jgi:anti-sigma regulatory factor (Ser/Thr protein kinase)
VLAKLDGIDERVGARGGRTGTWIECRSAMMEETRASFRPVDTAPAQGRRVLDQLSETMPAEALDDARLLLSELITNAVRHAADRDAESITMLVRVSDSELFVEITDRGRGFGVDDQAAAPVAGTGWGLFLLDRLSDAWGIRTGGGVAVWFRLRWGGP